MVGDCLVKCFVDGGVGMFYCMTQICQHLFQGWVLNTPEHVCFWCFLHLLSFFFNSEIASTLDMGFQLCNYRSRQRTISCFFF